MTARGSPLLLIVQSQYLEGEHSDLTQQTSGHSRESKLFSCFSVHFPVHACELLGNLLRFGLYGLLFVLQPLAAGIRKTRYLLRAKCSRLDARQETARCIVGQYVMVSLPEESHLR